MSFGVSDQSPSQYDGNPNEDLRLAIANHNRALAASIALRRGAAVDGLPGQQPPLCFAAQEGNFRAVILLLREGADPFLPGPDGLLPVTVALNNDQQPVAQLLVDDAKEQLRQGQLLRVLKLIFKEPRVLDQDNWSGRSFVAALCRQNIRRRSGPIQATLQALHQRELGAYSPARAQREVLCQLIAKAALARDPQLFAHLIEQGNTALLQFWRQAGLQPQAPLAWPAAVLSPPQSQDEGPVLTRAVLARINSVQKTQSSVVETQRLASDGSQEPPLAKRLRVM